METLTKLEQFKRDTESVARLLQNLIIGSESYRERIRELKNVMKSYRYEVGENECSYLLGVERDNTVTGLMWNVGKYITLRKPILEEKEGGMKMNMDEALFKDETLKMLDELEEGCKDMKQSIEVGYNALTLSDMFNELVKKHVLNVGYYDSTELLKSAVSLVPENGGDYTTVKAKIILVEDYISKRRVVLEKEEKAMLEPEVNYVRCEYCNEMHPDTECFKLLNGNYVCDDCREEHYYQCEECGHLHCEDDMYWVEDEGIEVCEDCFNRYFATCNDCGKVYRINRMTEADNGYWYCDDCYCDRFTSCDECGCEVERDYDAYWTDDDRCLCSECYDEYISSQVIHQYHDCDVCFDLNTHEGELLGANTLTLGIEHEVGGDPSYAEEFLSIVNGCDFESNVALFKDCSVDGFEIVSMPMTLEYLKKDFLPRYEKGLEFLRNAGFKGENEGGIHIHFNAIEDSLQVAKLCNILYGTKDDVEAWCKITNRTEYEMDRWCSMKDRRYSTADILEVGLKKCTDNRHTALNYDDCRTNTHELRIFNSTLDIDLYKTYVEVLMSLLDFIQLDTGKGAFVNTRDYVEYIRDNAEVYTMVHDHFIKKEIYNFYGIVNNITVDDIFEPETYTLEDWEQRMMDEIVGSITREDIEEAVG